MTVDEMSKVIAPFRYYVMTREQQEDIGGSKRPIRWLYRSVTPAAAVHQMRTFAQWFNNVMVWDVTRQGAGAMLSNSYPLTIDPVAPEIIEEFLTVKIRPEGKVLTVARRKYAYPHPKSTYQG